MTYHLIIALVLVKLFTSLSVAAQESIVSGIINPKNVIVPNGHGSEITIQSGIVTASSESSPSSIKTSPPADLQPNSEQDASASNNYYNSRRSRYMRHIQPYYNYNTRPSRYLPNSGMNQPRIRRRPQQSSSSRPQYPGNYPNRLKRGRRPPPPRHVGLSRYKNYYPKGSKGGNLRFKKPNNNNNNNFNRYEPQKTKHSSNNHYNNNEINYPDYDQQDQDDEELSNAEYEEDSDDGFGIGVGGSGGYKIEDVEAIPSYHLMKKLKETLALKEALANNKFNDNIIPLSSIYQELRRPISSTKNRLQKPYDYDNNKLSVGNYLKLGRLRLFNNNNYEPITGDIRYKEAALLDEAGRKPTSINDIIKWSTSEKQLLNRQPETMIGNYQEIATTGPEKHNMENYFVDLLSSAYQQMRATELLQNQNNQNNLLNEAFARQNVLTSTSPFNNREEIDKFRTKLTPDIPNDFSLYHHHHHHQNQVLLNNPFNENNQHSGPQTFYQQRMQESRFLPPVPYGTLNNNNNNNVPIRNNDQSTSYDNNQSGDNRVYGNIATSNPVIHSVFNNKPHTNNNWQEAVYSSRYRKHSDSEDNHLDDNNVAYSHYHVQRIVPNSENGVVSSDKNLRRIISNQEKSPNFIKNDDQDTEKDYNFYPRLNNNDRTNNNNDYNSNFNNNKNYYSNNNNQNNSDSGNNDNNGILYNHHSKKN